MALSGRWSGNVVPILGISGFLASSFFGHHFYPDMRANRHIVAEVTFLPDVGPFLAPEHPTNPHRFRMSFPAAPKDAPLFGYVYGNLAAGETVESKFLFGTPYDDVSYFEVGTKFDLWKDRQVGFGEVVAVDDSVYVNVSILDDLGPFFTPSPPGEAHQFQLSFPGEWTENPPIGFINGDFRFGGLKLRLDNASRDGKRFRVGSKFQLWSNHRVGSGQVVKKEDPGRPRNAIEAAAQAIAITIVDGQIPFIFGLASFPLIGLAVVGSLTCALVWSGRRYHWHGALVAICAALGIYFQLFPFIIVVRESSASQYLLVIVACIEFVATAGATIYIWLRRAT